MTGAPPGCSWSALPGRQGRAWGPESRGPSGERRALGSGPGLRAELLLTGCLLPGGPPQPCPLRVLRALAHARVSPDLGMFARAVSGRHTCHRLGRDSISARLHLDCTVGTKYGKRKKRSLPVTWPWSPPRHLCLPTPPVAAARPCPSLDAGNIAAPPGPGPGAGPLRQQPSASQTWSQGQSLGIFFFFSLCFLLFLRFYAKSVVGDQE